MEYQIGDDGVLGKGGVTAPTSHKSGNLHSLIFILHLLFSKLDCFLRVAHFGCNLSKLMHRKLRYKITLFDSVASKLEISFWFLSWMFRE